jgi:hypothetical protein
LALKHLYGCDITEEADAEAIGLFATGCWLGMQDLIDSIIDSTLQRMTPETLAPLIYPLIDHYYGRAGERILASAKAMLCRDGWEMPLKYWDGIPGEMVREIVGGDGFFVSGEWDRWVLAKRLLDRRLKQRAVECGLADPSNPTRVRAPDTLGLMSIRFDTPYRKNAITTRGNAPTNQNEKWISLYTHPDVEPLLVLLDEGIHYVHLDFEQLQFIRQAQDVFGLPLLPDNVVTNALWNQMELRQRILSAGEGDLELGLSQVVEPSRTPATSTAPQTAKGKRKASTIEEQAEGGADEEENFDAGSWDANGRPRKFWIPSTDCNILMGGIADPVAPPNSHPAMLRHVSQVSASIDPANVQWATDFAASPSTNIEGINRPNTPGRPRSSGGAPRPVAYTTFPPFRFSAEFPNPRHLKENKRFYSQTVFYAGSLWNIYVQKVRPTKNPDKSPQLGVYLHRAKERKSEDVIMTGGPGYSASTVDERIGVLEREMILRSEQRRIVRNREVVPRRRSTVETRTSERTSVADSDATTLVPDDETESFHLSQRRSYVPLDSDSDDESPTWESDVFGTTPPALRHNATNSTSGRISNRPLTFKRPSTLPPYVDPRPTIKTYFKIYSPSKGGRLLSVYESAPDKFDFSQSWGWRSSTLMLDEVWPTTSQTQSEVAATTVGAEQAPGNEASAEAQNAEEIARDKEARRKRKRENMLRFMVVIGNL